jgi:hypothetical protein
MYGVVKFSLDFLEARKMIGVDPRKDKRVQTFMTHVFAELEVGTRVPYHKNALRTELSQSVSDFDSEIAFQETVDFVEQKGWVRKESRGGNEWLVLTDKGLNYRLSIGDGEVQFGL